MQGYNGDLIVVGEEPHMPYDRPPLSKEVLAGSRAVDDTALAVPGGIGELDVDWRLGRRALGLDVNDRQIDIGGGEFLSFDAAVIATGAAPRRLRVPGSDLPGVHVLRTRDDLVGLIDDLAGRTRVAVVGAGFIGCEVASSCRQRGLDVALVEARSQPLFDALGPTAAHAIEQLLASHGVGMHMNAAIAGLVGDDRVTGVDLEDGTTINADLVVMAVGVSPNTDWLSGSGLVIGNGVVCDSTGQAAPGVFAAGDVARWDHPRFGSIRVEHWTTAVEHGLYLGERILHDGSEAPAPFDTVPFFWSDLFDAKLQFVGVAPPDAEHHVIAGLGRHKLLVVYALDGLAVGTLGIDCPAQILDVRDKMGRTSVTEVERALQPDSLPMLGSSASNRDAVA